MVVAFDRAQECSVFLGGLLVTRSQSSGVGRERRRTLEKWLACLVLLLLSILGAQPSFTNVVS